MSITGNKFVTAAVITAFIISVLAVSGTSAAVQTTVAGPDEVIHPDSITLTSTVEIREGERLPVDNYKLTVRPVGEAEKEVEITFDPDGTIVEITPERGAVGEGEIRINILERTTDIRLIGQDTTHGYGDLHGYDERTGDSVDFGYGYGYGYGDTQPTFTYEIDLDARAFKHGNYEVFLTVNADEQTELFRSNAHEFEVLLPSERAPRGPPDDQPVGPPDDRPGGPSESVPPGPPADRASGASDQSPPGPPSDRPAGPSSLAALLPILWIRGVTRPRSGTDGLRPPDPNAPSVVADR